VIPVTLWTVLFVGALSAGAIIGALAMALVYGRGRAGHGRLAYRQESFSVVTSVTTVTAEMGRPTSRDLATQGPASGAQARPRLPR
jgi:hypothetical protein